jgi:hypothetical protein
VARKTLEEGPNLKRSVLSPAERVVYSLLVSGRGVVRWRGTGWIYRGDVDVIVRGQVVAVMMARLVFAWMVFVVLVMRDRSGGWTRLRWRRVGRGGILGSMRSGDPKT